MFAFSCVLQHILTLIIILIITCSVYDEVPAKFRQWTEVEQIRLAIYSSGSVLAQQLLFAHTLAGDLTKVSIVDDVGALTHSLTTFFFTTSTSAPTLTRMWAPSRR